MARNRAAFVEYPSIPCASIAPGRVHWYDIPAHWYTGGRSHSRPIIGRRVQPDPERAAYRSHRNAMDATGWLWLASRGRNIYLSEGRRQWFQQAFWTLTLPVPGNEAAARRALSSWFTWARNVGGVGSYLWVAELTKRGRVHFHVLVNEFVDVRGARSAWLRALQREGIATEFDAAPGALVKVLPVTSNGEARGYVSKYLGKDFGDRGDQLQHRLDQWNDGTFQGLLMADGFGDAEILQRTTDARAEIADRLHDHAAAPLATRRRWGASLDLMRAPLQLIGADDPHALALLNKEIRRLDGVRWGPRSEEGQACYFDVQTVTRESCPWLYLALNDAAPTPAPARAHNARGRCD